MTAWQDQPPQSRRQLRLNERAGAHGDDVVGNRQQDSQVDVAESVEPSTLEQPTIQHPDIQQQSGVEPPRDAFARPGWDAPARRDAAAPENPASATHQPRSRAEAAIASGRRSLHSFPHTAPADPHNAGSTGAEPHGADSHGADSQGAEPLNYFTQGRSQVPVYGGPSFGVNAVTPPPADADEPGQSGVTAGGYRIRDFSPESRRGAFSSTAEPAAPSGASTGGHLDYYTQQGNGKQAASEQPPVEQAPAGRAFSAPGQSPAAAQPADVHAADIDAADTHTADAPAADASGADHEVHEPRIEHTMTRRELRAMRESSAGAAVPTPLVAPVPPTIESSAPHAWSIGQVEPSAPEHENFEHENFEHENFEHEDFGHEDFGHESPEQASPPEPSARAADRFPFDLSAAQSESPAPLRDPIPLRSPLAPEPKSSRELSDAMAEFDALMARGSDAVPLSEIRTDDASSDVPAPSVRLFPVEVNEAGAGTAEVNTAEADAEADGVARREPEPDSAGVEVFDTLLGGEQRVESDGDADHHYVAPAGHWSRQGAGDEAQIDDGITLRRDIGTTGGAVTASHLVISSVPTVNDLLKPFSPTGEIMITGTIDLPRSLGTTGAHPARYDHSDVDTLLEASDREDSNVDSAPVRAIRAVSTHTSSRGLIGSGKPPRSSKLPMILAVSTAAVAAVVVVLFVAGLLLRVF